MIHCGGICTYKYPYRTELEAQLATMEVGVLETQHFRVKMFGKLIWLQNFVGVGVSSYFSFFLHIEQK